jgi:hypothetical protein
LAVLPASLVGLACAASAMADALFVFVEHLACLSPCPCLPADSPLARWLLPGGFMEDADSEVVVVVSTLAHASSSIKLPLCLWIGSAHCCCLLLRHYPCIPCPQAHLSHTSYLACFPACHCPSALQMNGSANEQLPARQQATPTRLHPYQHPALPAPCPPLPHCCR